MRRGKNNIYDPIQAGRNCGITRPFRCSEYDLPFKQNKADQRDSRAKVMQNKIRCLRTEPRHKIFLGHQNSSILKNHNIYKHCCHQAAGRDITQSPCKFRYCPPSGKGDHQGHRQYYTDDECEKILQESIILENVSFLFDFAKRPYFAACNDQIQHERYIQQQRTPPNSDKKTPAIRFKDDWRSAYCFSCISWKCQPSRHMSLMSFSACQWSSSSASFGSA